MCKSFLHLGARPCDAPNTRSSLSTPHPCVRLGVAADVRGGVSAHGSLHIGDGEGCSALAMQCCMCIDGNIVTRNACIPLTGLYKMKKDFILSRKIFN